MTWTEVENALEKQNGYLPAFHPTALEELNNILQRDRVLGKTIVSALIKLSKNPLPQEMGGLGKRLWKQENPLNLHPLLFVKLKTEGVRIVYALTHQPKDQLPKIAKSLIVLRIN